MTETPDWKIAYEIESHEVLPGFFLRRYPCGAELPEPPCPCDGSPDSLEPE